VLIVDDEIPLAKVVASYFVREGFSVTLAHDGPQAVEQARTTTPDLIVLDWMIPEFDGLEACRQIRTFTDAYVIMLTARDDETDKVIALSVGADDYIVKPFSPRELIARAKAMLRRPRNAPTTEARPPITIGALSIDLESRIVTVDATTIELTRTEFDLLAAMAMRPKMAFDRRQLLDEVWGGEWFGDDHVVDVHVGHLRRKLGDDPTHPRFIRTVRGVGYGMGTG
jgi:DNA-binding response OmpR family regulator